MRTTTRYGPVPLRVSVRADGATLRLRAVGRLDASTAPTLVNLVHSLVEPGFTAVHADLSGIRRVDDAGVEAVLRCRDEVERGGRRFVIDGHSAATVPALLAV